jgi:hypothetical protein
LALDPPNGWAQVSKCLVNSFKLVIVSKFFACGPSTENKWIEYLTDFRCYDLGQLYTW